MAPCLLEKILFPTQMSKKNDSKVVNSNSNSNSNISNNSVVKFVAETNLPTLRGTYRVRAYRSVFDGLEPVLLIFGDLYSNSNNNNNQNNNQKIPLFVHRQCFIGEILGGTGCECRQALDKSLIAIRERGCGIVAYMPSLFSNDVNNNNNNSKNNNNTSNSIINNNSNSNNANTKNINNIINNSNNDIDDVNDDNVDANEDGERRQKDELMAMLAETKVCCSQIEKAIIYPLCSWNVPIRSVSNSHIHTSGSSSSSSSHLTAASVTSISKKKNGKDNNNNNNNNNNHNKGGTFLRQSLENVATVFGVVTIKIYHHVETGSDHVAVIKGDVNGKNNVKMRVHDQCYTSEAWGSLKCDCKDQLDSSLQTIQSEEFGLVLYLTQEGRGIGLANKIAAYALQEQGYDTVEANRELGFPDDMREYDCVKDILEDLNVKSVILITNNPRKVNILKQLGIVITDRKEIFCTPNIHSLGYLKTKKDKMDHWITHL